MADLTAEDVTITVNEEGIEGKRRRNRVTLVFGDGVDTYPTSGIPLPTFGNFGMRRNLDGLTWLDEANGNGFVYKYDRANHKLRIYQGDNNNASDAPLIELTNSATPAQATLIAEAIGW